VAKHLGAPWLTAPLPPVGRRRRRVLSDRLRARALVLGLRPPLSLEDAAAALASQAGGNRTALRRALRGLSLGDDGARSPAAEWAASALRLAEAHAKWSGYDDIVREPALRSYLAHPSSERDLASTAGDRPRWSDAWVAHWPPDGESGRSA
jgi:hypothetical protein